MGKEAEKDQGQLWERPTVEPLSEGYLLPEVAYTPPPDEDDRTFYNKTEALPVVYALWWTAEYNKVEPRELVRAFRATKPPTFEEPGGLPLDLSQEEAEVAGLPWPAHYVTDTEDWVDRLEFCAWVRRQGLGVPPWMDGTQSLARQQPKAGADTALRFVVDPESVRLIPPSGPGLTLSTETLEGKLLLFLGEAHPKTLSLGEAILGLYDGRRDTAAVDRFRGVYNAVRKKLGPAGIDPAVLPKLSISANNPTLELRLNVERLLKTE